MPDLVNISQRPVDVYAPSGNPDSLRVEPGQTITVPGEVRTAEQVAQAALAAEPDTDADRQEQIRATALASFPSDAYLIGEGDDARLWPHSQWELKTAPAKTPAAPAGKPTTAPAAPSEGTN